MRAGVGESEKRGRAHLGRKPRHCLEIKDGGLFISVVGKNDIEIHCC